MSNHMSIVELARNIERAKAQWDRANHALLEALGMASGAVSRQARPARGARRGPGSDSVSQQVLQAIQSSPNGLARAELLLLFPGRESAVQSALKKHASDKRVKSVDGRWTLAPAAAAAKKKGPTP